MLNSLKDACFFKLKILLDFTNCWVSLDCEQSLFSSKAARENAKQVWEHDCDHVGDTVSHYSQLLSCHVCTLLIIVLRSCQQICKEKRDCSKSRVSSGKNKLYPDCHLWGCWREYFLLFHDCLCKLSVCLHNKKKITQWLEDMNIILPCCACSKKN